MKCPVELKLEPELKLPSLVTVLPCLQLLHGWNLVDHSTSCGLLLLFPHMLTRFWMAHTLAVPPFSPPSNFIIVGA